MESVPLFGFLKREKLVLVKADLGKKICFIKRFYNKKTMNRKFLFRRKYA